MFDDSFKLLEYEIIFLTDFYLKIKLYIYKTVHIVCIKNVFNLIRKESEGHCRKIFCLTLTFKSS